MLGPTATIDIASVSCVGFFCLFPVYYKTSTFPAQGWVFKNKKKEAPDAQNRECVGR